MAEFGVAEFGVAEFGVDRVQAAQGRPAHGAEVEARHDPLPSVGVVYPSLRGLAIASGGLPRAGTASGRPVPPTVTSGVSMIREVTTCRSTRSRSVAVNREVYSLTGDHSCPFSQRVFKNGLSSVTWHVAVTIRAVHGMVGDRSGRCHFPLNAADLPCAVPRKMNRWASASVLSVDGPLPAGRGAGPAPDVTVVRELGDAPPRAVALHANPWLTFQLVPRGRGYRARGRRTRGRRGSGGTMRERAGSAHPSTRASRPRSGVTR